MLRSEVGSGYGELYERDTKLHSDWYERIFCLNSYSSREMQVA